MKKIDNFLIILYLSLIAIILAVLIVILDGVTDRLIIGICLILSALLTARSFHLENYLRLIDSKGKLGYLEHLSGLLNNLNKAIGLGIAIRPILDKNEFRKERQRINLLTVLLYIGILLLIIFIVKFDN